MQHKTLMCDVREIAYHFDSGIGVLKMAALNCCDMTGCVELFKAIDPKVKMIITVAGSRMDTIYHRHNGEWQANLE